MATRWNFLYKLPKFKINIELPEKYKGTVVERIYRYWEALIDDYTKAFKEAIADAYESPLKTAAIVSGTGFCAYATYSNPTKMDFKNRMIEYQNQYGLVGKPVRNPSADVYLKYLQNAHNYGLIRRFSFGIFSIIWLDNYDGGLGLYKAQCSYLKPQYRNFHERIIDIGFLNRFWVMEKKMLDYDVNPNEWIDFSKNEYVYRHRITNT